MQENVMLSEQIDSAISRLNGFPWAQAESVSPWARKLMLEHVSRMQRIIDAARSTRDQSPNDTYAEAQSAGYDAQGYNDFISALFRDKALAAVPFREHIILAVASNYYWEDDQQLAEFPNPWTPILELYEQGYVSTMKEDYVQQTVQAVIWCRGGEESFRIV